MNSPRYLNLFKIALPLPGISSILHRISAIAIFVLSLPMMGILVFSLSSEANYQIINSLFENFLFKSLFSLFITAIFYHFISGLRHLVMDFGYWETLKLVGCLLLLLLYQQDYFSFLICIWHGNEVIQIKENRNL